MRGGYKIIDLAGVALTSGVQATIKGVYDAVKNPYKKATMVSGLVIGTTVYPELYAAFTESSETYTSVLVVNGATITLEIATGDKVTATVVEAN